MSIFAQTTLYDVFTNDVICILTSSIMPSLSVLNICRLQGLTAVSFSQAIKLKRNLEGILPRNFLYNSNYNAWNSEYGFFPFNVITQTISRTWVSYFGDNINIDFTKHLNNWFNIELPEMTRNWDVGVAVLQNAKVTVLLLHGVEKNKLPFIRKRKIFWARGAHSFCVASPSTVFKL